MSSKGKGETRRNRLGALIPQVVVRKEVKRRGGGVEDLSGQHYNQCDKATNKDQARERDERERERRERNREKRGLAQWF